ncbi:MAG: DUF2147 domain-containing protein [Pseudomonadota bacterium]
MKYLFLAATLLAAGCGPLAALGETAVSGEWVTADGEALLSLDANDGALTVELLSVASALSASDETPRHLDRNNPNTVLRDRPLAGLVLGSLSGAGNDGRWRGRLYDPSRGKAYRVEVRLIAANVLRVRAYVGVKALGRTMLWVRRAHFEARLNDLLSHGAEE